MEFFDCLDAVRVPAGTRRIRTESADIARSLNQAIEDMHGDWVWFMGDDHTFHPDTLLRLLGHGLPAVCPLNIHRHPPYGPVLLRGEIGGLLKSIDWSEVPAGNGLWVLPRTLHTGQAGLLIQKSVLDKMPKPWFQVGRYDPAILNEDIWFNQSLRDLGIPTTVDLGAAMGHINSVAARPFVKDGKWHVGFFRSEKLCFAAEATQ